MNSIEKVSSAVWGARCVHPDISKFNNWSKGEKKISGTKDNIE